MGVRPREVSLDTGGVYKWVRRWAILLVWAGAAWGRRVVDAGLVGWAKVLASGGSGGDLVRERLVDARGHWGVTGRERGYALVVDGGVGVLGGVGGGWSGGRGKDKRGV